MRRKEFRFKLGKCYFLVNNGIFFGYKVFVVGIEVDSVVIDVMIGLSYL